MTHQFREDGSHYNGGTLFFGYGYKAVGQPRLKMIRRWYRQGKRRGQSEDQFYVDGAFVPDYAAALVALTLPTVFTAAEVSALSSIGDQPADWRKIIGWEVLHSLGAKGAIEWDPLGQCRRTDIGRTACGRMNGAEG